MEAVEQTMMDPPQDANAQDRPPPRFTAESGIDAARATEIARMARQWRLAQGDNGEIKTRITKFLGFMKQAHTNTFGDS